MLKLTKEEVCYLAGILDGEGHIVIYQYQGKFALEVGIANTNEELIRWIAERLESAVAHWRSGVRCKVVYSTALRGKRAQEFLKEIEHYLIVKKLRAQLALEFPLTHKGERCSQEKKLKQAILCIQIKDLNRKGVPQEETRSSEEVENEDEQN